MYTVHNTKQKAKRLCRIFLRGLFLHVRVIAMKILISDNPKALGTHCEWQKEYLEQKIENAEVDIYPYDGTIENLIAHMKNVEVLITAFIPMTAEVLAKCPHLRCISLTSTGFNLVDLEEADRRNITVASLGEYCTEEVAEHTLAMILAGLRQLKSCMETIDRDYIWGYTAKQIPTRLQGQKVGIFGYGRIGKRVGELLQGFGAEIWVYQPPEHHMIKDMGIQVCSAEEIFENCTVITNHMAQNNENIHFFNGEAFAKMKQYPLLVNTGRGNAIDEDALIYALDAGMLRGAALDVLADENPDLLNHPLRGRRNVILTPHVAFYSKESMDILAKRSCDNVLAYIDKERKVSG